jgi:hypothetical protein
MPSMTGSTSPGRRSRAREAQRSRCSTSQAPTAATRRPGPGPFLEYDALHSSSRDLLERGGAACRRSRTTSPTTPTTSTTACGRALLRSKTCGPFPFVDDLPARIDARYPGLETSRRIQRTDPARPITRFVEDVVAEGERPSLKAAPRHADDVRRRGGTLVCFSERHERKPRGHQGASSTPHLVSVTRRSLRVLRPGRTRRAGPLSPGFMAERSAMPAEWQSGLPARRSRASPGRVSRTTIAGMDGPLTPSSSTARLFDVRPGPSGTSRRRPADLGPAARGPRKPPAAAHRGGLTARATWVRRAAPLGTPFR